MPKQPSPLLIHDLLYTVNDMGVAICLEAESGQVVWKERLGGNYSSSPIHADGRIYCFNRDGRTTVIRPGRSFKILAVNDLDEELMASPAVADKAIFLRTRTHLYRIEK
jgi:outer membrane protein assembly factor BamB